MNSSDSKVDKKEQNGIQTEEKGDDLNIEYISYSGEQQMPGIIALIEKDLSEPLFYLYLSLFYQQLASFMHNGYGWG